MSKSRSKRKKQAEAREPGPAGTPGTPEQVGTAEGTSEARPGAEAKPGTEAKPGAEEVRSTQVPVSAAVPVKVEGLVGAAARLWLEAYRVEVLLFVVSFVVLASFSSQRFLRQSGAPHFVYQAQAWMEGRLDIDPEVLPNKEDWACVREVVGRKVRCEGPIQPGDRWYVSFPSFPAVVMLPFVALHGHQFNDTSFGVIIGALSVAFFYSLLRFLAKQGETERDKAENVGLALLLAFGTLFFYAAIRGEVWFSAEVMGVGLTCLYVRNAVGARRPVLAGLFFSMATLTRTPLLFTGLLFVLEVLCPGPHRWEQLRTLGNSWRPALRKLGLFAAAAAPLALLAAAYNQVRFGRLTEFGHRFLYDNRVNVDIDTKGLFSLAYLSRNLESAFFMLPKVAWEPPRLGYDPNGLSLLLTLPLLVFLLVPRQRPRLHWPLWLTVAACALPGLLYQNNGYAQFGFRFSLDYTPYLLLLFAIGGWSLRRRAVLAVALFGVLVNFWGAIVFRGYTEYLRRW